jgi:hypothetical protein
MRKIYGPTRTDDGYWRIKTNQEVNDILKGQNIIGFHYNATNLIHIHFHNHFIVS